MKPIIRRPAVLIAMVALACMFIGNSAFAAITAVTRTGATQTNCAPTLGGALVDGAQAYCDRTDPVYTYTNFDPILLEFDLDYIIVAVEDRTLADYGLEVTVDYPGYLFLFIEDGLDTDTYMPWLAAEGYGISGLNLTLAKQGAFDDVIMDVWVKPVSAGDIQLGPFNMGPQEEPGTGSIYGVAYFTEDADVGLSLSDSPDPVLAGSGEGNFTLTVTAENAADATNNALNLEIDVSATGLDDGMIFDVQAPVGTTFANGTWSVPDLCEGCSMDLVLTYTVGYQQTSGTDVVTWNAEITAAEIFDPNPDNDTATEATSVTDAASQSVGFDTSIDFLDDADSEVTATLTCNAGLPLSQSFDISEGSGVNFSMTNLPFTTPGTICEITLDGLDAVYDVMPESCVFEADSATDPFAEDGANTCAFVASAGLASYTVSVDWLLDDPNVEEADYSVEITATCDANILTVNGSVVAPSMQYVGPLDDGESVVLGVDVTTGAAECSAEQSVTQSGVESEASEACTDAELTAGGSAECLFTNTVFFEGIPTLNQYGMALMALLMLGVGFVGFRRFV